MVSKDVSNMPENTAFKQQRLPAWQPVLTASNVLPTFIIVGFIFIPLGVVLLLTSNNCFELIENYTDCISLENPLQTCHEYFNAQLELGNQFPECTCNINLKIEKDVAGPVYFYYRLTNYQNHRIYVKSRDNKQLTGGLVTSPNRDCAPYQFDNSDPNNPKPIAPCGTIANSLFNDTYQLKCTGGECDSSTDIVAINRNEIAWTTDHTTKFNNPQGDCASSDYANSDTERNLTCAFPSDKYAKPPFWKYSANEVYKITNQAQNITPTNYENGYKDQALEVWMRTAAFPTFRKLYGKLDGTLYAGDYELTVNYNYPVKGFDGTKSFVVAQMTWAGGKNPFLGIAYIVVGSMSLCSAVALFFVYRTHQRRHPSQ